MSFGPCELIEIDHSFNSKCPRVSCTQCIINEYTFIVYSVNNRSFARSLVCLHNHSNSHFIICKTKPRIIFIYKTIEIFFFRQTVFLCSFCFFVNCQMIEIFSKYKYCFSFASISRECVNNKVIVLFMLLQNQISPSSAFICVVKQFRRVTSYQFCFLFCIPSKHKQAILQAKRNARTRINKRASKIIIYK